MRPRFPSNDGADVLLFDAVSVGQSLLGYSAIGILSANYRNVRCFKIGLIYLLAAMNLMVWTFEPSANLPRVPFSPMSVALPVTTLRDHVAPIVIFGAKPQMANVYTLRVVTVMKDVEFPGVAKVKHPHIAVRPLSSTTALPVSVMVELASPLGALSQICAIGKPENIRTGGRSHIGEEFVPANHFCDALNSRTANSITALAEIPRCFESWVSSFLHSSDKETEVFFFMPTQYRQITASQGGIA